ncbi:MAG TPA: ribonuclease HII [Bacteroidota bacterium]|nr:ribonuclease HII [Bacteroidota bacterium]
MLDDAPHAVRAGVLTDLHLYERRYWDTGIVRVAGVDEAGRGPLAGPVVAAAVIMAPGLRIPFVKDSKQISEKRREAACRSIIEQAVAVGVGIVEHDVIDRINILQASMLAMNKAIDQLSVEPQQLLVDGNFFRHPRFPVENIVHGDALSHSIAAASIVAKVTRDDIMRRLDLRYPGYGFARHKGYGTPEHVAAIHRYGLSEIHRRSFRVPGLEPIAGQTRE